KYAASQPPSSFRLTIPRPPTPTLFPYTTLFRSRANDPLLQARIQSFETAFGMQMEVPHVFDLATESDTTLDLYGLKRGQTSGFRSEEHTSELQSRSDLVCRLLLEKKKKKVKKLT